MGWIWFWGVFILFLIALAWSHIHLHLRLFRSGQDVLLEIKIQALYGMIRYTFKSILLTGSNSILDRTKPSSTLQTEKTRPSWQQKQQRNNKGKGRFLSKIHMKRSYSTLKKILTHVKCTHFEWRTRVGLHDASKTAVLVGLLWSLKSSLVGLICNLIRMKSSPNLAVIPLYNQNVFFTEGKCIVKIRFGYAMFAGILLLIRSVNVKGGIRTWMSTRFKVS